MKKIICITIILAMLMGLVPVGVGAESTVEKPNSTTGAEAVSTEDEQEWLFYQNYHDIYFDGPFYDPRFDRVEFYEEVYYHFRISENKYMQDNRFCNCNFQANQLWILASQQKHLQPFRLFLFLLHNRHR